jgi:hypothetical protein
LPASAFQWQPSAWQAFGSPDDTTAPKSSVGGRGGATGSSPIGRALVGLWHSIVPLCTLDVYSSRLFARPPTSGRRCRVLHPRRRPSALSSAPGAFNSEKDPWARRRKTHSYNRHCAKPIGNNDEYISVDVHMIPPLHHFASARFLSCPLLLLYFFLPALGRLFWRDSMDIH